MIRKLTVLALLASSPAIAAPFIEADVVTGVASCGVVLDGGAKATVPAANLKCRYDLAGIAQGQHTVTMTAMSAKDPLWGTQESVPSAPFGFSVPATPAAPGSVRLVP